MMKRTMLCVGMFALLASAAFGATGIVGKDGQAVEFGSGVVGPVSTLTADFEYNTGGTIDMAPTLAGSDTGWGSHFMGFVNNNTGQDLYVTELGFPCSGPSASIWFLSVGAMPADFNTQFSGPLTIADTGDTSPPTVYSYVDLSESGIVVPAGVDVYFGYLNPGLGGQVDYNGTDTWAWYFGAWDLDEPYGRTAIVQIKASFEEPVAIERESFGAIKALFR